MSVRPIREPDWLFVPPLELPLALRLENGRFGALRPRGPALQIHEAVDLAAHAGDPVYAAYSGRIAEVETNPAATRGNVTIDHHPRGLGFDPPTASGPAWPNRQRPRADRPDAPAVRLGGEDPAGRRARRRAADAAVDCDPAPARRPVLRGDVPGDTATVLHVPLYEPVTADERLTIDLLRHA